MAAKAEEIPPPPAAVAGGASSQEPPLEEAENREGARLAKRRRTFPATLETLSSPAAVGEELGESGRKGFSFSFDARSVAPIETTPKFGSFNCSALDLGAEESALIEKKEIEEDQKGERKRRRTSPPALETRSSPAGPEAEEENVGESGGSAGGGFSFSFEGRSVGTVEAAPKFGSLRCAAADLGSGKAEAGEGGAEGSGEGKIGI
ncbi:uncharacterized protein [Elaeis guineensis]|uniref:Uncharacterized protein LOC105033358 n=1 Tax=Elaeis guineensis var. tenera TaxID=51953 RepID=A0A6I9QB55_ELAGV|nr:uncharacterized protein LOC105033358 [Elaeis guineensis]XP_029117122.1 uncharacterized protein LOC105033358 [Elaeis guineensis]